MAIRNYRAFCSYSPFLLVVVALSMSHAAVAADSHRLELKDIPTLVGTPELVQASDVAISPDGNWVAYTVTSKSLTTMQTKQRLFVQPFEGGEATQIGPSDADNSGPVWAPDSSKLLFYTTSGDRNSVAIWNVADKKTRVTDITPRVPVQWLPDSARFVVGISGEKQGPEQVSDQKNSTPFVVTSGDTNRPLPDGHYLGLFSLATWGTDSLSFAITDAASGAARTVARNVDTRLTGYQISPDGTKLVYGIRKGGFDYDGNKRNLLDIAVVDLLDGSTNVVASDVLGSIAFPTVWSRNGRMIAVVGGTVHDDAESPAMGSRIMDRPAHCYVIDLEHPGKLRAVGPRSFSRDVAPTWASDDSSIYLAAYRNDVDTPPRIIKLTVATGATDTAASLPPNTLYVELARPRAQQDRVYITDLKNGGESMQVLEFNLRSHQLAPITDSKMISFSPSVSATGVRLAYLTIDSSHPISAWAKDRSAKPHELTRFGSEEQRRTLGKAMSISWQFDGKTRFGTVWLPPNYREGQRYPTIVDVYPGGQGSLARSTFRGDPFFDSLIWQAFSARGYVVFWPDFILRVGDGPHEIAARIIPALDKLVAMGIADPNGFGVFGGSWGGYSTFSLITETQRFKAAVTRSGYSNLFTAYGELDDNSSPYCLGLEENDDLGVSPWQNRELYIKNSPYFNFDKVTAPVLIEYGAIDRPFAWTSREAFVALRRLGKTVTLLGYPDEGHGVNKPENQVDFTNRALEWFDRYLKPASSASAGSN